MIEPLRSNSVHSLLVIIMLYELGNYPWLFKCPTWCVSGWAPCRWIDACGWYQGRRQEFFQGRAPSHFSNSRGGGLNPDCDCLNGQNERIFWSGGIALPCLCLPTPMVGTVIIYCDYTLVMCNVYCKSRWLNSHPMQQEADCRGNMLAYKQNLTVWRHKTITNS